MTENNREPLRPSRKVPDIFCPILTKCEDSQKIVIKVPIIKFQGHLSSGRHGDARGQTDFKLKVLLKAKRTGLKMNIYNRSKTESRLHETRAMRTSCLKSP